jgi:hypothetical protein
MQLHMADGATMTSLLQPTVRVLVHQSAISIDSKINIILGVIQIAVAVLSIVLFVFRTEGRVRQKHNRVGFLL